MKTNLNQNSRLAIKHALVEAQKLFMKDGISNFEKIETPAILGHRKIWHLKNSYYELLSISNEIDVVAIVCVDFPGASPHYHVAVDTGFLPVSKNDFPYNSFLIGFQNQVLTRIPMKMNNVIYADRGIVHGIEVFQEMYYLTAHIGKVLRLDDAPDVIEVIEYQTFCPFDL